MNRNREEIPSGTTVILDPRVRQSSISLQAVMKFNHKDHLSC